MLKKKRKKGFRMYFFPAAPPPPQVEVNPIRNEAELVVLFLCNYRDITAFKVFYS